ADRQSRIGLRSFRLGSAEVAAYGGDRSRPENLPHLCRRAPSSAASCFALASRACSASSIVLRPTGRAGSASARSVSGQLRWPPTAAIAADPKTCLICADVHRQALLAASRSQAELARRVQSCSGRPAEPDRPPLVPSRVS